MSESSEYQYGTIFNTGITMKLLSVCMLAAIFAVSMTTAEPHYIGSDKCAKMCHKGEKKGSQYEKWQNEAHSKAYKTLATAPAKETAKNAGITGDPQKAPECLRCHVTAPPGVKKELIDSTCTYAEGIGCEGCHGPGSDYRKLNAMKNHEMAVAAGMIEQTEASCVRCHNRESPNYKPFNYAEAIKKIAHPIPGKASKK